MVVALENRFARGRDASVVGERIPLPPTTTGDTHDGLALNEREPRCDLRTRWLRTVNKRDHAIAASKHDVRTIEPACSTLVLESDRILERSARAVTNCEQPPVNLDACRAAGRHRARLGLGNREYGSCGDVDHPYAPSVILARPQDRDLASHRESRRAFIVELDSVIDLPSATGQGQEQKSPRGQHARGTALDVERSCDYSLAQPER
jgi:hypothetical protein